MKYPTPKELVEFKQLYNEFKDWKEERKSECVTSTIVRKLTEGLDKDDPWRIEAERLIRWNRYIELRTLCAPYFFANIDINVWSLMCYYEANLKADPKYYDEPLPKPTRMETICST